MSRSDGLRIRSALRSVRRPVLLALLAGALTGCAGTPAWQFADEPGTVTSPVPGVPVRHVFVMLKELGEDPGCTSANPFRGRLGEIAIAG